jgi:hypothetical protein
MRRVSVAIPRAKRLKDAQRAKELEAARVRETRAKIQASQELASDPTCMVSGASSAALKLAPELTSVTCMHPGAVSGGRGSQGRSRAILGGGSRCRPCDFPERGRLPASRPPFMTRHARAMAPAAFQPLPCMQALVAAAKGERITEAQEAWEQENEQVQALIALNKIKLRHDLDKHFESLDRMEERLHSIVKAYKDTISYLLHHGAHRSLGKVFATERHRTQSDAFGIAGNVGGCSARQNSAGRANDARR